MMDADKRHGANGMQICGDNYTVWIDRLDLSEEKVEEIMGCIELLDQVVNSGDGELEWKKCG